MRLFWNEITVVRHNVERCRVYTTENLDDGLSDSKRKISLHTVADRVLMATLRGFKTIFPSSPKECKGRGIKFMTMKKSISNTSRLHN